MLKNCQVATMLVRVGYPLSWHSECAFHSVHRIPRCPDEAKPRLCRGEVSLLTPPGQNYAFSRAGIHIPISCIGSTESFLSSFAIICNAKNERDETLLEPLNAVSPGLYQPGEYQTSPGVARGFPFRSNRMPEIALSQMQPSI